jgi:hypothetical protein
VVITAVVERDGGAGGGGAAVSLGGCNGDQTRGDGVVRGQGGADHRRVVMWWGGEAVGAPPWPRAVGGTGGGKLLMKEDEAELRAGEGGDGGSGRTHGAHV